MHNNLLFIMGTQRSGTTLLARALSAHSDIFVQNEISVEKVFEKGASKDQIRNNISKQLQVRHGQTLESIIADGHQIVGVKDPQFTEHINGLRKFLPESKFIIIVRDGRGVVNSYIDNKWGLGTNAYTGALRWFREVTQQKAFMNEMPENFILIRYEDLVTDLTSQLKVVCDFLSIPFDDGMLSYHEKKAKFRENESNINTNSKPDVSLTQKWKVNLTKKEIGLIEYVANEELIANGYQLEGPQEVPSSFSKFFYHLHQTILGEIQIQYQLKRVSFKRWLRKFK